MPTPRKDETEGDFVSRCIPVVLHDGAAKDDKQAAAICHSIWRKSKGDHAMTRQWFTMQAEGTSAEISIYDEIGVSFWGDNSVSAKDFNKMLADLGDVTDIALHINSPGGDVFDGITIHNALKNHKAKVTAHIDGLAASIASYIAMAADKIVMPANAFLLLHNASGFVMGTADDVRALADDLDRIDNSITATYAARSKQTATQVKKLLKEDRLMDAAEAKSLGFADEVTKEVKLAAKFPLRLLPAAVAARFRAETGPGDLPPTPIVEPEEREESRPLPLPAPLPAGTEERAAPPAAEVVDLNAAKQTGIEEHRAYVSSVTDLCALAQAPEKVGDYVRANTPIDTVRKELLDMRAAKAAVVMPHHPLVENKEPATLWAKITDKLNARAHK